MILSHRQFWAQGQGEIANSKEKKIEWQDLGTIVALLHSLVSLAQTQTQTNLSENKATGGNSEELFLWTHITNFSPWLTNVKIQELCQRNLYPSKTVGNKYPQSQGNVETRLHGHYLGQHQHRVEDVPSEPSSHGDCSLPLKWFPVQKEPPESHSLLENSKSEKMLC